MKKHMEAVRLNLLALVLAIATIAVPVGLVYAAANRSVITSGPATMATVAADINEELTVLYTNAPQLVGSVSGTNTVTGTITPTLPGYVSGQSFWIQPTATNTGAVTLNLSSLGARNVLNAAGVALSSGDFPSGTRLLLMYDGTAFRIIGGAGAGGGAPTTADYVTLSTNGTLSNERVLTAGQSIDLTDAGAGSTITVLVESNGIGNAQFRQSVANSVVGRATNSTGNVADIQCTVDGTVLRLSGTTLGCGTLASGAFGTNVVADTALRQGAARSVIGRSANSTGNVADIVGGGVGTYLNDDGASLAFRPFTTISADFNLTGDITPATITATQNDYNPTGLSSATIIKASSDASRSVTGLVGGADGRVIIFSNVGSNDIILENEDAGSTAANRFAIGGDVTLTAGNTATLFYDTGTTRWRLSSDTIKAAAGGGEANTASNVNSAGTGVFVNKVGVDLRFRGINTAASGQGTSVTNDSGNNEIDIGLDITGMTEDTSPDQAADFAATFDASAALNKKVKLDKIGAGTKTIGVPAAATVTETTSGCVDGTTETTTNQVMYLSKDCDAATQEGVQFMVPMPKSTAETTVTFRAMWTAASGTGDVIWLFSCLARSDDDPIDTAFGTEVSVTDTLLTAGDVHQTPESGAVTPGGTWAENDNLWCRIQRDADAGGDTLGVDAKLLSVRVLYSTTVNTDN